jgi:hypothetical protein
MKTINNTHSLIVLNNSEVERNGLIALDSIIYEFNPKLDPEDLENIKLLGSVAVFHGSEKECRIYAHRLEEWNYECEISSI